MTAPNGVASGGNAVAPGTATELFATGTRLPPEEVQKYLDALAEPFDPSEVEWVVTATMTGSDRKLRGQVAAYADQRAYTDRLNELFTPAGWTREYAVQVVQNFERGRTEKVISAKVMVTCRLTIFGLGTHSGTGEEWADDQNALTRAEAQAFKRACVCFGLGRYFYDLPRTWVDLDQSKRIIRPPDLPDWALPRGVKDTHRASRARAGANATGAKPNGRPGAPPSNGVDSAELVKQLKGFSDRVGKGLFGYTLRSVAGTDKPDEIRDPRKLKTVIERLQNVARGVVRLQAGIKSAGTERYAALCRELNLPSAHLDDIPDTTVLRRLVETLEAKGIKPPGPAASTTSGNGGTDFERLRAELLTEARKVAAAGKRTMAEVIATASGGAFGFADIAKLQQSDLPKLQKALAALRGTPS
jgi:hypothetical protein